jgi:prepilin-type processing-associated H-X9-DG protein
MQFGPIAIASSLVLVVLSVVVFGSPFGFIVFLGLITLAICLRGPDWRLVGKRLAIAVGAWGFTWLAITVLTPACGAARECARRLNCVNNMKTIQCAMHNYAVANKCFPPAYVADKNGRPMHSWRVLLLPYLGDEEAALYKRYNLDEPWDGPNNQRLLAVCPSVYVCPIYGQSVRQSTASYAAVVGKNALWLGDRPREYSNIPYSKTVATVEVTNLNIPWTEPRDLWLDASRPTVALASISPCRYHYYPDGAFYYTTRAYTNIGFADGSVRCWPMTALADRRFSSVLCIGGYDKECEEIAENGFQGFDWGPSEAHILWDNCIIFGVALLAWLASIGVLAYDTLKSWKPPATNPGTDTGTR